jgi:hypothetical protein
VNRHLLFVGFGRKLLDREQVFYERWCVLEGKRRYGVRSLERARSRARPVFDLQAGLKTNAIPA